MYIAICDDNQQDLCNIINLLEEYKLQHLSSLIYETFNKPESLLERMKSKHFDLLILDIVMPTQSGLDLAKHIRTWDSNIPIMFLTSSEEFAIESYRIQVQDYLLKPIDKSDFFASLTHQKQQLLQRDSRIFVNTSKGIIQLFISTIVYIEIRNRKLLFFQTDGNIIEANGSIQEIEQALSVYPQFAKPHRSYLVNFYHVKSIDNTWIFTITGTYIPIARGNFMKLKNQYMNVLLSDTTL
ncbi:MAG: LytTR family DNA-binding domain-containing protein [Lachnospiraceae bacterium]